MTMSPTAAQTEKANQILDNVPVMGRGIGPLMAPGSNLVFVDVDMNGREFRFSVKPDGRVTRAEKMLMSDRPEDAPGARIDPAVAVDGFRCVMPSRKASEE